MRGWGAGVSGIGLVGGRDLCQAWDELYGGFGKPVKVEPPNALMDLLDRFEWKAESVMPPSHSDGQTSGDRDLWR